MKENIKFISLLAFILPIFTVLVSFYFSIKLNLVQFCIPNLEGCTSISRVGRYQPVNYFFKTFMFMSIFFIFLYWRANYILLSKNKPLFIHKTTFFFGFFSIIFFFLYIFFLGEGDYYKFFRKIGIFIFIFFTLLSELLLSISFNKNHNINLNYKVSKFKLYFNIFIFLLGVILLPLVVTQIIKYPNFKNIASWNYFFLIQINFLITYFYWISKKNYF